MPLLPKSLTTATNTIDGESKLAERIGREGGFDSATMKHLTFMRWLYMRGHLTEWELRYQFNRKSLDCLAFMRWLYETGRLYDG
jgi:hypothetical protein